MHVRSVGQVARSLGAALQSDPAQHSALHVGRLTFTRGSGGGALTAGRARSACVVSLEIGATSRRAVKTAHRAAALAASMLTATIARNGRAGRRERIGR